MMRLILALALILLPVFGAAQDARPLRSEAEVAPWRAVGLLTTPDGFCTATLVRARLVLTAAHCVYDTRTGRLMDLSELAFRPGWHEGTGAQAIPVTRTTAHREYDPARDYDRANIRRDIALVELAEQPDGITPLPWLDRVRLGSPVSIVSYGESKGRWPVLQTGCEFTSRSGDMLEMNCIPRPGSSGAPVFVFQAGRPLVVSLLSGTLTRGSRKKGLGVDFSQALKSVLIDRGAIQTATAWDTGRPATLPQTGIAERKTTTPGASRLPQIGQ